MKKLVLSGLLMLWSASAIGANLILEHYGFGKGATYTCGKITKAHDLVDKDGRRALMIEAEICSCYTYDRLMDAGLAAALASEEFVVSCQNGTTEETTKTTRDETTGEETTTVKITKDHPVFTTSHSEIMFVIPPSPLLGATATPPSGATAQSSGATGANLVLEEPGVGGRNETTECGRILEVYDVVEAEEKPKALKVRGEKCTCYAFDRSMSAALAAAFDSENLVVTCHEISPIRGRPHVATTYRSTLTYRDSKKKDGR